MKAIEDQIRRAIEEGKFDHLPGKGKPLHLDQNPHEDPAWSAAYRILQNSGHTLPWIETRQELEANLQDARSRLARTWAWRVDALAEGHPPQDIQFDWERSVEQFHRRIADINRKIRAYNLEVPHIAFQLSQINPEKEIQRIRGNEN